VYINKNAVDINDCIFYESRDRVAEMWVTLGMHNYKTAVDVNRQSLELDMNSFFFHPDYSETLTADIALIKLPSVVTFSSIKIT
jgi:hypothetical protein